MQSVYDTSLRKAIIARIQSLDPSSVAQWGKMDVYQMLKHCTLCEDMFQGRLMIKRVFIGRLLGPMFLRKSLNDQPFGKNAPTSPLIKTVGQTGDIAAQKQEWIDRLEQYSNYTINDYVHPFFGPMSNEQIGIFVYKHADHHLRQFGG